MKNSETPVGYSHTSIGLLPNTWRVQKLSEIIESLDAGVSVNSDDKPASETEFGILKTSAVSKGKFYPLENKVIKIDEFYRAKVNPIKNSIIISRMNTPDLVGEVGLVEEDYNQLFLPDRLWQTSYKGMVSGRWLVNLLLLPYYRRQIKNMATGTSNSMKNISKSSFLSLEIPKIPYEEQCKIASILYTWDKAIELKEKLIEQKKEQKKGLMQKLLTGKVRLPGFEGGWKEVTIGDIGTLKGGSAFPEKYQNLENGRYPFFKVSDMNLEQNDKYMIVANNYINDEIRSKIKANVIPSGSIVFAKVGAALLLERKKILREDACIDNNLMALKVNKEYERNYIYYLLHAIKLSKVSNTGALPSLNAKDVYSIKVNIPMDQEEQKKIGDFFTIVDKEIRLLHDELSELKLQKNGLMQLLLTGKVRVKV